MLNRQLLFIYTLLCVTTICGTSQTTNNVKDSKGRQGLWKVWLTRSYEESTDSTLAPFYRIVTYKNDIQSGSFSDHFRSGSLYRKGKLIQVGKLSVPDGVVEVYRESGSLEAQETYHRGKRSGPYTKYAISGAVTVKGEFDEDRRVGTWTTFYESGKVKSRGSYVDNYQDGEWTTYLEDGSVKETNLFADGRLIEWSALLELCEKTSTPERITDALRYWEQARTAVYSSFGATSLPAGRLHMARCRIAWIQENESLSLQHLDTAIQIFRGAGDVGRVALRDAVRKIIDFAHEQYATTLLTRLTPVLIEIMDHDTTIDYTSCKRLLGSSCRSNVVIIDHSLLRMQVRWASEKIPQLATVKDSAYTTEMYGIWHSLLTSAYFMKEFEIQAQCRREAEALPGLTNNLEIQVLRIQFLCTRAMDIIADSAISWPEKKHRLLAFLDESRAIAGLTYGVEYSTVASYGIEMMDTAFVRSVLNKVPIRGAVATSGTKYAIASHYVWLYLAEQHCDSARKYLEEVRVLGESFGQQSLYDRYKLRVENCGKEDIVREVPEVDTLRRSNGEKPSSSLGDLLSIVMAKDAHIIRTAINKDATSEQRLQALLLADSTATFSSAMNYLERYSRVREIVRPSVERQSEPIERAEALFRVLHDSILRKYVSEIPLRTVLENGHYNCVSAVALYSLLCKDFGIPLTFFKAPGHIACGIPEKNNVVIPVELTSPTDGFRFIKQRDSLIAHLLSFKLVTQDEVESIGVDSIFRQYYDHSRIVPFESIVSAVASNAMYRAYYDSEKFDDQFYESFVRVVVLDSSEHHWGFKYPLLRLASDTAIAKRIIRDTRYMAAYFYGQEQFISMILPILGGFGVVAHTHGQGASVEEAYQALYDHTREDSSGLAVRRVIESAYAVYRIGIALMDGHSDTAYAYYKLLIRDSSHVTIPLCNRVVRAYADDCIKDYAYSTALNAVEDRFRIAGTSSARVNLVQVSAEVLQSSFIQTIDSSEYRRIVRQFMKEYTATLPDKTDQVDQLKYLLDNAIYRARHELGSIAIAEATASGVAKDDLRRIGNVHSVMLHNRSSPVSLEGLEFGVRLYLGDIDGPVTTFIPSGKTTVNVNVKTDGLEPGQQFSLKVIVKSPNTADYVVIDQNIGATDRITYCNQIFSAYMASLSSKATIDVFVNGKKVLSKDYEVR